MIERNMINIIILIITTLIAFVGVILFNEQKYNVIIIMLATLSCLPFYFKYEFSKPQTREVVILAIMIALTVMLRGVFMIIPSFKPVSALVIICGVVFGRQDGFMCGSLSALISDFMFGIGPWTPFQMLAWGLIGYLAGMFSNQLEKNKYLLYLYAVFAGLIFSLIMDLWSVLSFESSFNLLRYVTTVIASMPIVLIYVISNVVFMFLFRNTLFQILNRVKIKYGISKGD